MSQGNQSAITAQPQQNGPESPDDQQQQLIAVPPPKPGVPFGLEFLDAAQQLSIMYDDGRDTSKFGTTRQAQYSYAILDGENRIYMAMLDFFFDRAGRSDVNLDILNNFGQPVINGKGDFDDPYGFGGKMVVGQGPDVFGRCNSHSCCRCRITYDLTDVAGQCFLAIKSPGCFQTSLVIVEPAGGKVISKIGRDCCGGTCYFAFPPGLDVRMKAVFLGAIFLFYTRQLAKRGSRY